MKRTSQGGFTLLEVMTALVIFLVGVVSVLALLTSGTSLHSDSQHLASAADVAEEVLLLAQREVALQSAKPGAIVAPPPRPLPGHPDLTFAWQLRAPPEPEDLGPWLLVAEVNWQEGGKTRTRTFERVLPRLADGTTDADRLLGKAQGTMKR